MRSKANSLILIKHFPKTGWRVWQRATSDRTCEWNKDLLSVSGLCPAWVCITFPSHSLPSQANKYVLVTLIAEQKETKSQQSDEMSLPSLSSSCLLKIFRETKHVPTASILDRQVWLCRICSGEGNLSVQPQSQQTSSSLMVSMLPANSTQEKHAL
jgi:hypothetical protein